MAEIETYSSSGVNRAAADALVEKIAVLASSTRNPQVKASVGGYASLYAVDKKRWLAASTDGVGTKLKLAFETGIHDTVGVDLVAMSVNDLLCVGAEPLFFLDYFATGGLQAGVAEKVLAGIVSGCKQARCALVGGETAEMPGFYAAGEYDLAGFAVGQVEPRNVLPSKKVRPGDVVLGLASSGLHSNGFSLVRKWLDGAGAAEKARLLEPTTIYVEALRPLLKTPARFGLRGLAHVTGSGFLNLPRVSEAVSYRLTLPKLSERAAVFDWVYRRSGLSLEELSQTFNLGVGMLAVVEASKAAAARKQLKRSGIPCWLLGEVVAKKRGAASSVTILDPDHPDREVTIS